MLANAIEFKSVEEFRGLLLSIMGMLLQVGYLLTQNDLAQSLSKEES
jgi:hypothetical protein